MERERRRRCVGASIFCFAQATDPFDHVVRGKLLEVGSMAIDLSLDRRAIAIACLGQPSLSISPCRQGGLDFLSPRQIGLLPSKASGRTDAGRMPAIRRRPEVGLQP
jgi:hypothetical protein